MGHSSNRRYQQSQTSQDDKRSNVSVPHDEEKEREQSNPDRAGEGQNRSDRKRDDRQIPGQQNDKRNPEAEPPSVDRDAPGRRHRRTEDDGEKERGYRPGASEDYEPEDSERPGR